MLRRVTWRAWVIALGLAAGYGVLGFWLNTDDAVEYNLYKWGLTALTFLPLILMAIYTFTGNKWWANDLGTALGWLSAGITWTAWPLAYTFWFLHGSLSPSWVGWCEVSGPGVVSLAIARLCYVFLRYHRDGNSM